MSENERTTDIEARVKWLEQELARIVAKVDAGIVWGDERDTPTPKPTD